MPDPFNILNPRVLEWINTRSLLLAKSINETTLKSLRLILAEAEKEGLSIREITNRISGYFPENETWRAERIARTEILTANNEGAIQRYKDAGVKEFEWMASPDSCEECAQLDGQIFDISQPHPPLHPFCRCTVLSIVSE